ncbi:MAG TPA: alpha/beta-hydrolase family protein [Gemmatimonas sp.]|uniref:alpha/beta hydrolase n=1 Tax=Gemmatimonas sp. TaxID=1962908 RepID=UPI002ED8FA08
MQRTLLAPLPAEGAATGMVLAALSLTPSLLPRAWALEGVLCGLAMCVGYAVGLIVRAVWRYLEFAVPAPRMRRGWVIGTLSLSGLGLLVGLVRSSAWQNDVRAIMGLPPLDEWYPWRVAAIAIVLFVCVLTMARLFMVLQRAMARPANRLMPRRVSAALGFVAASVVVWTLASGVLLDSALRTMDRTSRELDQWMDDSDAAQARRPESVPLSPVTWESLGRHGRRFIAARSDTAAIRTVAGTVEAQPVRVYVGLSVSDSIATRVDIAFAEMLRRGAFERRVLLITTPTGSGWVDPPAVAALEYLYRGDVATVAVQYSYLPSWLSLLAESAYGSETASALFHRVYSHWRSLPRESRPRLYVHGVSLGALNSGEAVNLYDLVDDPIDGALWVGPPFRSTTWRALVDNRDAGTPMWLPVYRGGSTVRFANQMTTPATLDAPWGRFRILYLQYASDPVSFFDASIAWQQPEWLHEPRGHDVTPRLRWYPLVTMLQLAIDFMSADKSPRGFGHMYSIRDYVKAWAALTDVPGWTPASLDALAEHLATAPCCRDL